MWWPKASRHIQFRTCVGFSGKLTKIKLVKNLGAGRKYKETFAKFYDDKLLSIHIYNVYRHEFDVSSLNENQFDYFTSLQELHS